MNSAPITPEHLVYSIRIPLQRPPNAPMRPAQRQLNMEAQVAAGMEETPININAEPAGINDDMELEEPAGMQGALSPAWGNLSGIIHAGVTPMMQTLNTQQPAWGNNVAAPASANNVAAPASANNVADAGPAQAYFANRFAALFPPN